MVMGNLTRDPEIRYTPKGTAVGEIGLACNRRVKINEEWTDEVTFIDVTLWGRDAENAQKYLTKGQGVFVEGRLQLATWVDKASGQKRSKLKVVGESCQWLPSAKQKESSDRARESKTEREAREARESGGQPPAYMADGLDAADDIPF